MARRTAGFVAAVGILVFVTGGIALSRSSWVEPYQDGGSDVGVGAPSAVDPVSAPAERRDGPLSVQMSDVVVQLPGIRELLASGELSIERSDADVPASPAGVVGLTASDGSRIDIVFQRLPVSIPLDREGMDRDATVEVGPSGEDVIVRDIPGRLIQVMAVDEVGRFANVIVQKINRVNPGTPSLLDTIDAEHVKAWTTTLLSSAGDGGW